MIPRFIQYSREIGVSGNTIKMYITKVNLTAQKKHVKKHTFLLSGPALTYSVFVRVKWNAGTPFSSGRWFSTTGDFCLTGDIWQNLKTFLAYQSWGLGTPLHLMHRVQGCSRCPATHGKPLPAEIYPTSNANRAEERIPP